MRRSMCERSNDHFDIHLDDHEVRLCDAENDGAATVREALRMQLLRVVNLLVFFEQEDEVDKARSHTRQPSTREGLLCW